MNGWLFDLGNSRLKAARLGPDGVGALVATVHDGADFASGWEAALPQGPGVAWLASVAPVPLCARLQRALQARGLDVRIATVTPGFGGIDLGATEAAS
ncbi:MAG TPA: pantothenate kinase, partial [Luteimonas sp.]|nr:pantothenate kinase [Luteimonas sp.]